MLQVLWFNFFTDVLSHIYVEHTVKNFPTDEWLSIAWRILNIYEPRKTAKSSEIYMVTHTRYRALAWIRVPNFWFKPTIHSSFMHFCHLTEA